MKQHYAAFSVALLILFNGCSILRKEHNEDIVGVWAGKGVVASGSVRQDWDVTVAFNKDMTLTLSYARDDKKIVFHGNYTADLSQYPAVIDIRNFGPGKGDSPYCCMAIAEFPAMNRMNISGLIGKCGEVSRPAEFIRDPSHHRQLNFELTKRK